jgi:carnitine O-acetyltransferase
MSQKVDEKRREKYMPFRTLFIRDLERNIFDWTTKITDGDVAFIIDQDRTVLYVFNGSRTSMLKKYEAGVIAPKIKSALQLYPYKIVVIDQGEEPGELKAEIDNLLRGEGTPIPEEERGNLASAVETLAAVKADSAAGPTGDEKAAGVEIAAKLEGYKAKKETFQGEIASIKEDYEKRIKEMQSINEKLNSENAVVKNEIEALKNDFEGKIKYVELEKEKLKLVAESARKDVEGTVAGLEGKVKYLELEKEKAKGEGDASRNELASTKAHYEEKLEALQYVNEGLKKDHAAAKMEAESAKKENEALKSDMEQKIRKIKEEHAEKVKLNFFNMRALPSAPAGTVWFESIVQVVAGDKTVFTKDIDPEKLKELQKTLEKPKETKAAEPVPTQVTIESKAPAPTVAAAKATAPSAAAAKAAAIAMAVSKTSTPAVAATKVPAPAVALPKVPAPTVAEPKAEQPHQDEMGLDFVNIEKEDEKLAAKRKKGDVLDFPDIEK